MKLLEYCHARSGEKGPLINIGVIAFDKNTYPWLAATLTSDVVKNFFGERVQGEVDRYELPNIGALNFVLHDALDGGATRSRMLDAHGKGFAALLLELEIDPPSSHG